MNNTRTYGTALALSLMAASYAQAAPIVVGFERLYEAQGKPTAQQGRVLLGELGCTACHDAPEGVSINHKRGPSLENLGARMNPTYLQAWLTDAHSTKAGTTMPAPMAYEVETVRAKASSYLTHFLMSRSEAFVPDATGPMAEDVARGNDLFHSVGCVACHAPQRAPQSSADEYAEESLVADVDIKLPSVPLPDLHTKTNHKALTQFLLEPHTTRPSGRMPNLKLSPEEASDIAAYLRTSEAAYSDGKGSEFKPSKYPIEKGKELYTSLGCIACHEQEKWKAESPALTAIAKGCLAKSPTKNTPWYNLDDRQRAAIQLALSDTTELNATTQLEDKIAALNCYACHERNGIGGIEAGRNPYFQATIEADLGDEGRIPPTLTGVGAKLTPKGFHSILIEGDSVRPYMATRMPKFGDAQVGDFAQAFLEVDKNPNAVPTDVSGLEHHHRSRYGRALLGTEGLSCITCHGLHGTKSLGIPAIDLATTTERLQPSWFKQYLLDPASLRPGTRMPNFFEGNKSPYTALWKGDAGKQVEAMWIYLEQAHPGLLPIGMEKTDSYELIPTDKPILLRTFMKDVGAQAITVGNPAGIHFAFDARHSRLTLAWRGKYIDAESAWADRFNPFVEPLSEDHYVLPAGMPIAAIKAPQDSWPLFVGEASGFTFKGYRLDEAGIPTFLYTLTARNEVIQIAETITAISDQKLLRSFVITGNKTTPLYMRRMKDGKPERIHLEPSTTPTKVNWEVTW